MSRLRRPATQAETRAYLWMCPEDELTAAINEGVMARATRFPKTNKRVAKAAIAKYRKKQERQIDEALNVSTGIPSNKTQTLSSSGKTIKVISAQDIEGSAV